MFEWFASPEAWIALATLMALEIVLGIDNIIFISILVGRLPDSQRNKARQIGLALAMGTRLILLFSLAWVMGLVEPLFSVFDNDISARDIILVTGGLFLLAKSTHEIHSSFEIVEPSKIQVAASGFFLNTRTNCSSRYNFFTRFGYYCRGFS
jgi:predicted tellurium resistance membrane protein TerC